MHCVCIILEKKLDSMPVCVLYCQWKIKCEFNFDRKNFFHSFAIFLSDVSLSRFGMSNIWCTRACTTNAQRVRSLLHVDDVQPNLLIENRALRTGDVLFHFDRECSEIATVSCHFGKKRKQVTGRGELSNWVCAVVTSR